MSSVILIIEDDVIMTEGMGRILNNVDYEAYSAYTGAEGSALADALRPDIVILDVNLPDSNGKEIYRHLKA